MYSYKEFYPIVMADDKVCCGAPSTNSYCEFDATPANLNLIDSLMEKGVSMLDINNNEVYLELFNRNLLYDSRDYGKSGENRNSLFIEYMFDRKLTKQEENTKILIFGAGAGGSTLCYQLCQMGFKNICVIDFDEVNWSDLSKITIYDSSDINRFKVDALKDRINSNFDIEISTYTDNISTLNEMESFIENIKPEIIVKAADPQGLFRFNLNKICFKLKIPFLLMSYAFDRINVGPFYIPGFTPCDNHFNEFVKKIYGSHYDYRKQSKRLYTNKLFHPSNTMLVSILSSLTVMELLFFITRKFELCKSLGKIIVFKPIDFTFRLYPVTTDEECPICSPIKINNNENK